MARNLDVIMDLAFVALRAGAQAATVIGLLQDVELPEHAIEPEGPPPESEAGRGMDGIRGVPLAATAGEPGEFVFGGATFDQRPDYRGEVGLSDSGLTGPPGLASDEPGGRFSPEVLAAIARASPGDLGPAGIDGAVFPKPAKPE